MLDNPVFWLDMIPMLGNIAGLFSAVLVLALTIRSNEKQADEMHRRYHEIALRAMACDCEEEESVTAMQIGGQTFRRLASEDELPFDSLVESK